MTNFAVRLFYEVFFELCLCLMINATYKDENVSPTQWYLSLGLSGIVLTALIVVTVLFYKNRYTNYESK